MNHCFCLTLHLLHAPGLVKVSWSAPGDKQGNIEIRDRNRMSEQHVLELLAKAQAEEAEQKKVTFAAYIVEWTSLRVFWGSRFTLVHLSLFPCVCAFIQILALNRFKHAIKQCLEAKASVQVIANAEALLETFIGQEAPDLAQIMVRCKARPALRAAVIGI